MKQILILGGGLIVYAGSAVSSIWAIVEFILYLVKDKEFNWWSVWAILICVVLSVVLFFASAVISVKDKRKIEPYGRMGMGSSRKVDYGKSRFMEKLERVKRVGD